MKKILIILLLLIVIFGVLGWISTKVQAPFSTDQKLESLERLYSVSKNIVFDSSGQPVLFKGYGITNGVYNVMNPADLTKRGYSLTSADYHKIRNSGANTVRFYLQYHWLDPEHQAAFFSWFDHQLILAKTAGLKVIPNLHYFGHADDEKKKMADGFYQGDIADNNYQLTTFWKIFSKRYAKTAVIAAYDLLNEPKTGPKLSGSELYQIYEKIIRTIRAQDDHHIIIVSEPVNRLPDLLESGKNLKEQTAFQKLSDDQIIYQFHWYYPVEFTHQGFFETPYFELGAAYPFTKEFSTYRGGYYQTPYLMTTNGKWRTYKTDWIHLYEKANCEIDPAQDKFNISLSAGKLDGKAWFDEIEIEKMNVFTRQIEKLTVKNANFDQASSYAGWTKNPLPGIWPAAWYNLHNPQSTGIRFHWDKTESASADNSGSVLIDGTNAIWQGANQWATWGQSGGALSTFYPIDPAAMYRIKGKVKITGGKSYTVAMTFNIHRIRSLEFNRQTAKKILDDYYVNWSKKNQAPLYCGEFGLTHPAQLPANKTGSNHQITWVNDILNALNQHQISWAYHCYRSYANRGDLFGLYDPAHPDPVLQNVLKKGFN